MRKIILTLSLAALAVFSMQSKAYSFAPGDQDCAKCHTLNNEQAAKNLSDMIPDVKILGVQAAAVKGLWEVSIESGGKKGIVYLDFSGKYVMAGNLFQIQTKTNITQDRMQELTRIDVSQIPVGDALLLGDANAKYKVIVFDDPD